MNANLSAKVFSDALGKLQKVCTGNSPLFILSGVLVEATEGSLTLKGTNLSEAITVRCDALVDQDFTTVIPFTVLHKFVSQLGDVNINLEFHNNQVTVVAGRSKVNLKCLNKDDFPAIPTREDSTKAFECKANELIMALNRVIPAASRNTFESLVNSVYISSKDNKLQISSTDKSRCHFVTLDIDNTEAFLLSLQSVLNIKNFLDKDDDISAYVNSNKTQVIFVQEDSEIAARFIEGNYPNLSSVIPRAHTRLVTCKAGDLTTVIKRVSSVADKNSFVIKLVVPPGKGETEISLSCRNNIIEGDVDDVCPVVVDNASESTTVEVNCDMLEEMVCYLSREQEIEIWFNGSFSPIMVQIPGYKAVLAPLVRHQTAS